MATGSAARAKAQRRQIQTPRVRERDNNPHKLARRFIKSEGQDARGRRTLRYWRSQWYRYREGRYVAFDDDTMRNALSRFVKDYYDRNRIVDRDGNVLNVNATLVNNTLAALRAEVEVDPDVEQPVWLDGGAERGGKREFLAVRNGLLDITDIRTEAPRLIEPSPLWFSPVAFPYYYDPSARAPRWERFLDKVLEGDRDSIEHLQEWFGYTLTPDTSQQKFLILEGEGQNGKSVVLATLTAMLGTENVSTVPLEIFHQRFALHSTLGRLANISPDVGEMDKTAEGTLKQFTSHGDRMHFDRKGISAVDAYPTARLVLATNNPPRFRDRSFGILRRMLWLPFRYQVSEAEKNVHLSDELKAEVAGVLNWSLEGLRRLRIRGRFNEPERSRKALEEYRRDSNPARVFLEQNCELDPVSSVPVQELYESYRFWAFERGYERLDNSQFGKEVWRFFGVPKTRRRREGGGRVYVYSGIRVLDVPSGPINLNSGDLSDENLREGIEKPGTVGPPGDKAKEAA